VRGWIRIGGALLCGLAALAGAEPVAAPPRAEEILRAVRDAFPDRPVEVEGILAVRETRNRPERTLRFHMTAARDGAGLRADVAIFDAFGRRLDGAVIERAAADGALSFARAGAPSGAAGGPAATILDSDATWRDLCMDFLWWTGGQTEGRDRLKGRSCWVVSVPPPRGAGSGAQSVRLWADAETFALMRVETLDKSGDPVRRFDVKSFKKLNGLWMLQDAEIRDERTGSRTIWRVRDARLVEEDPRSAARAHPEGGTEGCEVIP
jgi:hypothetical protein